MKTNDTHDHGENDDLIWITQTTQFDLPKSNKIIHVDENLPAATHAWYIVYLKDVNIPKPISIFDVQSVVTHASQRLDWSVYDPTFTSFWDTISHDVIRRWEIKQTRCTTSEEAAQVLEFIQTNCCLGGHLMCPIDELYKQFTTYFGPDDNMFWCTGFSSPQWIRHTSVQEALRICGVMIQSHYQNRVWPRGSGNRRHTTFAQGVDLKLLYLQ